jgi:hypothetical protein
MIATQCSDRALDRSRIEGRQRCIPNWYEVGWSRVERSLEVWEQPEAADLCLDAADSWEGNAAMLAPLFR